MAQKKIKYLCIIIYCVRVATRMHRSHGAFYPYRGSGSSLGRVTLSRGPKQTCRMAIRELNVHRGWFTADSPHLEPPRGAASARLLLVLFLSLPTYPRSTMGLYPLYPNTSLIIETRGS